MEVSIHKAKAELTKLIVAAERGEHVVLTRHGRPVVALKPIALTGGFDFSADDPVRAAFGLSGESLAVPALVDDHAFSREILTAAVVSAGSAADRSPKMLPRHHASTSPPRRKR